jgi:hypothetical protein
MNFMIFSSIILFATVSALKKYLGWQRPLSTANTVMKQSSNGLKFLLGGFSPNSIKGLACRKAQKSAA